MTQAEYTKYVHHQPRGCGLNEAMNTITSQ